MTSELLTQTTPAAFGFIGSRGLDDHHTSMSANPHNPVHDHDNAHHNNAPMIHAFLLLSCIHSFVFHIYMLLLLLRLTWLADPALVTSVYPNRMQYTPHVLQEVSLLDGVDASVRGNGRRFSKTSSYPPCHCYAFILFYPYFLTTSSSPLFWLIHSFSRPTLPQVTLQIIPTPVIAFVPSSSYRLTAIGNISYLWQDNVVKDSSWPLSCPV